MQNLIKIENLIKMTTSQKLDLFIHSSMNNKPIELVPGIDTKYSETLKEKGVKTACALFGLLLKLNRDKESFIDWLTTEIKMDINNANTCYTAYEQWCDNFF